MAGTSRQVAEFGVTINNLQPGVHDTDRIKSLDLHTSEQAGITVSEAKQNRRNAIPAKRYGTIQEFGAACAFLCSQQGRFHNWAKYLVRWWCNKLYYVVFSGYKLFS